jgi:hypothetical protein
MLKVKVAINNWDGQNDSLPSILDAALAGSGIRMAIVDNQDMSISIWILGDPSVALSEIDRLILDSAVNKGPLSHYRQVTYHRAMTLTRLTRLTASYGGLFRTVI